MDDLLEDWSVSNVMSLFRKGCKEKPVNHRPVSLTHVVGNLLETFSRNKIWMHLERGGGLIRASQRGFVYGHHVAQI